MLDFLPVFGSGCGRARGRNTIGVGTRARADIRCHGSGLGAALRDSDEPAWRRRPPGVIFGAHSICTVSRLDGRHAQARRVPSACLPQRSRAMTLRRIGETTGRFTLLGEYWCGRCQVRCRLKRGQSAVDLMRLGALAIGFPPGHPCFVPPRRATTRSKNSTVASHS